MNTLFIGSHLVRLSSVDSTNNYLLKLAGTNQAPEGTVVTAGYQEKGKGQREAAWQSEEGKNLLCSILLRPEGMRASEQFYINMAVSLAVRDSVQHFLPANEVKIKWPNDILADKRKVSGILIENVLKGEWINVCVAGIGMNVNQQTFDGLPHAGSLAAMANKYLLVEEVLEVLCNNVEAQYLQLRAGKKSAIKEAYTKHLYLAGERWSYNCGHQTLEGIIKGVSEEGKLLVETSEGIKTFGLKEIQFNGY